MMVFDLVLATRRPELTGIERYGVNLFKAAREVAPDTIAIVLDEALVGGPGVVTVDSALKGWLGMPTVVARRTKGQAATVICPSYPASPLFRFTRQRLIRIIHDCFAWTRNDSTGWQGKLLFKSIEEIMIGRYDQIAATTQIVGEEFTARFHRNVTCCGNAPGIDLSSLEPVPVEALKGRTFVLSVGTVEPRKNYDAILDLLRQRADWPCTFVVAGRPGWGDIADRLAAEEESNPNLLWLRQASNSEIAWLYANCACFLTLSHAEGFNMPLVEAGTMGCPIICSDLPIHRAVAAHWARFVSQGDGQSGILTTLTAALSEPRHRAEEYGRRFTWPAVARNIAGLAEAA